MTTTTIQQHPNATPGTDHSGSNSPSLDSIGTATSEPSELPRLRAVELNHALSSLDVASIRPHHLGLAMSVIELAADGADGEPPLLWSHDDPTVALLRAAAKLSMTNPNATSSAAYELIARLRAPAVDNS